MVLASCTLGARALPGHLEVARGSFAGKNSSLASSTESHSCMRSIISKRLTTRVPSCWKLEHLDFGSVTRRIRADILTHLQGYTGHMTITRKFIRILWSESIGHCAFRGCWERLCENGAANVAPFTLDEIAHICGDKPRVDRHDASQSDVERDHHQI